MRTRFKESQKKDLFQNIYVCNASSHGIQWLCIHGISAKYNKTDNFYTDISRKMQIAFQFPH